MKISKLISLCLPCILFPLTSSIFHERPIQAVEGTDLILSVVPLTDQGISLTKGFFRAKGNSSYQEKILIQNGAAWEMKIDGQFLSAEGIEYCFVMHLDDGSVLASPENSPFDAPHFLPVATRPKLTVVNQINIPDHQKMIEGDLLILSPDPGQEISAREIIIAASFFSVSDVEESSIKIMIDGIDVTQKAEISDGIIAYTASNFTKGNHQVVIRMDDKNGNVIKPLEWDFKVRSIPSTTQNFKYDGDLISKISTEYVGEELLGIAEVHAKGRFEVEYADLRFDIRRTSRDNPYMQPLDRNLLNINFLKYLDIKMGDFYEYVTPYTLDGRRVNGVSVELDLKYFKAQVINGTINEPIQHSNKIDGGYNLNSSQISIDSLQHPVFELERTGYTFKRNFSLTRLSLDIFNYQFGVHFMKATDDINSVDQLIGNQERFNVDSSDISYDDSLYAIPTGEYTYNDFVQAVANVNGTVSFSEKNWSGNKPQDNLVAGFDFGHIMDKERMKFEFSWNLSLFNRDIWDGVMTRTQLDTALDDTLDGLIGTTYDEDGKISDGSLNVDTLDFLDPLKYEDLFIMNINMLPLLPIDPSTLETNPISTIVNMPSSAFHLRLMGNYRYNKFTIQYRQIGPEFVSLANPYLDQNIREFTISDRLTLLDNKLLFNVAYKYRDDKILSTVKEPLKTTNLSFGVTFMPGVDSPTYVVNVQNIGKDNSKDELEKVGTEWEDLRENSKTLNTFFSATYPFRLGSINHILNINVNSLANEDLLAEDRKTDYFFQKSDSKTISTALSSMFETPLRTVFSISRTAIQVPVQNVDGSNSFHELTWTVLNSDGSYSLFKNKLKLNAGLSYLSNSGTTPVTLYGIKGGAEYFVLKGMTASLNGQLQMKTTAEETTLNTSVLLFSFRYNF